MICDTTGKTIFTKKDVQTFANKNKYLNYRYYHCPDCNMWHLAHKKTEWQEPKKKRFK